MARRTARCPRASRTPRGADPRSEGRPRDVQKDYSEERRTGEERRARLEMHPEREIPQEDSEIRPEQRVRHAEPDSVQGQEHLVEPGGCTTTQQHPQHQGRSGQRPPGQALGPQPACSRSGGGWSGSAALRAMVKWTMNQAMEMRTPEISSPSRAAPGASRRRQPARRRSPPRADRREKEPHCPSESGGPARRARRRSAAHAGSCAQARTPWVASHGDLGAVALPCFGAGGLEAEHEHRLGIGGAEQSPSVGKCHTDPVDGVHLYRAEK